MRVYVIKHLRLQFSDAEFVDTRQSCHESGYLQATSIVVKKYREGAKKASAFDSTFRRVAGCNTPNNAV